MTIFKAIQHDVICKPGLDPYNVKTIKDDSYCQPRRFPHVWRSKESRIKCNLTLKLSTTTRLPDMSMQSTKTAWLGNLKPSWTSLADRNTHLSNDRRPLYHSRVLPRLQTIVSKVVIGRYSCQNAALLFGMTFTLHHACISTLLPSSPPSLPRTLLCI